MHAYNVLAVSEVHMNSLSVPYLISESLKVPALKMVYFKKLRLMPEKCPKFVIQLIRFLNDYSIPSLK